MNNKTYLVQQLESYGLLNKEARTFVACLELGTAKMTDIARRAELKRPTTYLVIEELERKNLISRVQKGKIDYYKAGDLNALLENQIEKINSIKQILPELKSLANSSKSTNVSFYEGKNQISYIYDVVFRSKEIWSIVYLDKYWNTFGEEHNRHIFELLKRHGGIIHNLLPKSHKNIEYLSQKYRLGLQEVRFLPSWFDTSNKVGIMMNSHMIVFTSYESLTATAIEDEGIVKAQKQLWLTLWNQSEPFES